MLHRASSPSPAPPIPSASSAVIARALAGRHHGNHTCSTPQRQLQLPPTLPEKSCRTITVTTNQISTTSQIGNVPPVPPPLSAPRPPKASKDGSRQVNHHYENTIMICGTSQHVAKNMNLEANKARLTALMKVKDDPNNGGCATTKPESAAYENVNIEHITRLTALGFAQDAVIRALGITRNDLEMARDILHEFATKSS